MTRLGASIILAMICIPASASARNMIKIPYFKQLPTSDVCGGFNAYCQPNSSLKYDRVSGADYSGDPTDWLGRSYADSAFQRSACAGGLAPTDWRVSGRNTVNAVRDDAYAGALRAKLSLDLDNYLGAVLRVLPVGLQAALKADATDRLTRSEDSSVAFVYERLDLTMAAMDRVLPACYAKTGGTRKVVTGIATIAISGDWARSRLVDSFGTFEQSADFLGLTNDTKAAYVDKRNLVLRGSFDPLAFVIATAWRKAD